MLRVAAAREPLREEFVLPKVNGYKVLKADLHTHTIYSDGSVTPEFRVREAWIDGLDVLAITEHIEHRPREGKMISYLKGYFNGDPKKAQSGEILADLNMSNSEAIAAAKGYGITLIPGAEITRNPHRIGHYNALFVKDVNTIYDPDPLVSIRKAREQGALIMQNHPGWLRRNVDVIEFEQKVYNEGLIDGVEAMNDIEFYPPIVTRAVEKGFFIAANTDIHGSTTMDFVAQGHRRPMTFILAENNSLEAVKEALKARRTLAYFFGAVAGEEQLVAFYNQEGVEDVATCEGSANLMLRCYNMIIEEIALEYLPLRFKEKIQANNGKIYFSELSKKPLRIMQVFNENNEKVPYKFVNDYLAVSNGSFTVEYAYRAEVATAESDCVYEETVIGPYAIAYGMLSQYLLERGRVSESNIYQEKYLSAVRARIAQRSNIKLPARGWF
jgi:hypothetical protein